MKSRRTTVRIQPQWVGSAVAAVLTALFGIFLILFAAGGGARRLSYDLPFALRSNFSANEVALVFLDEPSRKELKQPSMSAWDRSLHARLIERLTSDGAKAIVFDMDFSEQSASATAEEQLERAIKRSGRVILAGEYQRSQPEPGRTIYHEEPPPDQLLASAAGWGNANLSSDPADYGVRQFFPNLGEPVITREVLWLPWAVAKFADVRDVNPASAAEAQPWLNYYGPPGTLPGVSYAQALKPDGVPPGYFKDKLVFIGGGSSTGYLGQGKDEFATPYSTWGENWAPGVEVHATATLNLIHGNWLKRLGFPLELTLVLLTAALAGFGLMRCQPLKATFVALGAMLLIAVVAHLLVWREYVWFAWVILVLEISFALFWSVVINSLRLYVEKRLLEQSLAAHLSPKLVKRLLNDAALRELGGSQQEVSILFSDIANFTRISESMSSDDLVRLMNKYFEAALECIHETDGTVIKLVGDGIFAVWNAPIEQQDHRERACRAALRLREQLIEFDATQRSLPLRTRVALHAGQVCVGNIGSQSRFDYTAIGDSINLTSRLEGLNKQLGTAVLVTREIQRAAENTLVWRLVGHFRFKGFGRVVEIHELIGPTEAAQVSKAWREKFAEALQDFRQRKFDNAAAKFQQVIELRRGIEPDMEVATVTLTADGPSRFYLERINEMRERPPAYEWIGEVELNEK
jgi:adenylate cyclase